MPTVLFVVAPEMFRDEEYAHPQEVLEGRGAVTVVASSTPGVARGRFGLEVPIDTVLTDVDSGEYDAVVYIGGAGSSVFFDDPVAHDLARAVLDSGRLLAAICIAPSTLAHAGLLRGVRATAYPSQKDDLSEHGALWSVGPVEIDGRIITANGPDAAAEFGGAIADALGLPPH
ncbi:MAG: DJ-1/PfpI family protein [Actinomycetota bacterium]|jgi:protease I|nr:DJ-1/PfpI family protein [Actinomycetota bacterium]MDZ4178210.1 DJ-1/PfpI family protein [Coriobacteriia bacterium]